MNDEEKRHRAEAEVCAALSMLDVMRISLYRPPEPTQKSRGLHGLGDLGRVEPGGTEVLCYA